MPSYSVYFSEKERGVYEALRKAVAVYREQNVRKNSEVIVKAVEGLTGKKIK